MGMESRIGIVPLDKPVTEKLPDDGTRDSPPTWLVTKGTVATRQTERTSVGTSLSVSCHVTSLRQQKTNFTMTTDHCALWVSERVSDVAREQNGHSKPTKMHYSLLG